MIQIPDSLFQTRIDRTSLFNKLDIKPKIKNGDANLYFSTQSEIEKIVECITADEPLFEMFVYYKYSPENPVSFTFKHRVTKELITVVYCSKIK